MRGAAVGEQTQSADVTKQARENSSNVGGWEGYSTCLGQDSCICVLGRLRWMQNRSVCWPWTGRVRMQRQAEFERWKCNQRSTGRCGRESKVDENQPPVISDFGLRWKA
jgi:hypothetical protein